jgi:hypothetical protein
MFEYKMIKDICKADQHIPLLGTQAAEKLYTHFVLKTVTIGASLPHIASMGGSLPSNIFSLSSIQQFLIL